MDDRAHLIETFVEYCVVYKDVKIAHAMTIDYATHLFFDEDIQAFMQFYNEHKQAFIGGLEKAEYRTRVSRLSEGVF